MRALNSILLVLVLGCAEAPTNASFVELFVKYDKARSQAELLIKEAAGGQDYETVMRFNANAEVYMQMLRELPSNADLIQRQAVSKDLDELVIQKRPETYSLVLELEKESRLKRYDLLLEAEQAKLQLLETELTDAATRENRMADMPELASKGLKHIHRYKVQLAAAEFRQWLQTLKAVKLKYMPGGIIATQD